MEKNFLSPLEKGESGTVMVCSLVIRAESINMEDITKNILVDNYKIVMKGEVISKIVPPLENDCYSYETQGESGESFRQILEKHLDTITPFKEYLQKIKSIYDVSIRIYVQSDFAQIYFELPPETVKKLVEFYLTTEISILSWGGVEDNMDDESNQ